MKKGQIDIDPFHDIKDWQDHRYDPGYFTGGNIHPLLKASRPNKYGYVLATSGLAFLFFPAMFLSDPSLNWYDAVLQVGMASLMIFAGLKLLRGNAAPPSKY